MKILARLMRALLWTDVSKMEMEVDESRKLTGKVAIVFGGSRGIGAAAARRLANEGADVAVTYVSAPERAAETIGAIEDAGRCGLAIRADSADPAAIEAAVAQAVDHFGRLDIAVVNAGILLLGDVASVSVEDLDHIERIKQLSPLKRAADPDEIAGLVAYIASKESGYMTGSSITIDGGLAL
jgi:NAD(P)-dependent dehydrogenase (short-subunit alcohol dehydrogenase family)